MKSVPQALPHCRSTPEREHAVDVLLQRRLRQAVLGDAVAQHAARLGLALEDGGLVAEQGQVAGGGQAARARADDRDLLVVRDRRLLGQRHVLVGVVGDEALEAADGDRLVDLAARAVDLALRGADATADGGEGVGLAGDRVGLGETALADQGHVALRRRRRRAGALAGRVPLLGDRVGVGDRLRVELVDRLALAELLVVVVLDDHGAHRGALAAARALVGVDEAGVVEDLGAEGAGLALEADELGVGDDLDVEVAPGLDQLRRQGAHRAVVGGEGLVELGHVAAEGRRLLDQVDLVAALGEVEGALDAGDTTT